MLARLSKTPRLLRFIRPPLQRLRHVEREQQAIERLSVAAHRRRRLHPRCKLLQGLCHSAAAGIDLTEALRFLLRRALFFLVQTAAAMPMPILFHRPARAANAEFQHIIFKQVDPLARLLEKSRLQCAEHGIVAPAAQHLECRAHKFGERMVDARTLVVAKVRNAAVLKRQGEHVAVGGLVARQDGDIAPAQPLLAAQAHDVGSRRLHFQPPRRRLDERDARRPCLRYKGEGKRRSLDGGKRIALKAPPLLQTAHAHRNLHLLRQPPQLLQGLRLPIEETALALHGRLVRRIERQRDMHILRLLEERCKNLSLLRIEEGEAVNPYLRPLQKARGRNLLGKRVEHVARIVVAPRHLLSVAAVDEREIRELPAQIIVSERRFRLQQGVAVDAVTAHLLHGSFQRLRKAALLRRTRKCLQAVAFFGEDALQQQPSAHARDARGCRTARLLQHMTREALEAEHETAHESLTRTRHHGGEAALCAIRRMFGQEKHEGAAHRLCLHALRHAGEAGVCLSRSRTPQDELDHIFSLVSHSCQRKMPRGINDARGIFVIQTAQRVKPNGVARRTNARPQPHDSSSRMTACPVR